MEQNQSVSLVFVALVYMVIGSSNAVASNTSGVHGPIVDPEDRSASLRIGVSPGDNGAQDSIAYRLHYQQSINQSLRWRVITQLRDRGEFEYDYLRAELLWYLTPESIGSWDSGVRFDIRTRKGSRPEQFSVHWTNQWALNQDWRLRAIAVANWQFGGIADTGMAIETRASLTYRLESGNRVGIEMFNEYGNLDNMGSFNDQEHSLGPVLTGKLSGVSYQIGYLAGLTSNTDDHTFRLWFNKDF